MNSAHRTLWILGGCNGGTISLGPARRGEEEQIKHKGGKEIKAASLHLAPSEPINVCIYSICEYKTWWGGTVSWHANVIQTLLPANTPGYLAVILEILFLPEFCSIQRSSWLPSCVCVLVFVCVDALYVWTCGAGWLACISNASHLCLSQLSATYTWLGSLAVSQLTPSAPHLREAVSAGLD